MTATSTVAPHERAARSVDAGQLLRIWLSPSFPVGSYAYSHGLEAAVVRGFVANAVELTEWIAALIEQGSLRNDLILLAEAWRAAKVRDDRRLAEINAMALAFQPSAERYLEATQQGGSFVATISAAWPCEGVETLRRLEAPVAYPIAVGAAAAGHAVPLGDVLQAHALAFAMNLVSAAIRLSVIGQTAGQRVIAGLTTMIDKQAAIAELCTIDNLGGAAFSSDLASLEHETLYSRLFRS